MSIFSKIKEKSLIARKPKEEEIVVAVPDIKEYLVREYERVNNLKLINEGLEQQIEKIKETELKYDATLVTLDEYSRRLEMAEGEIRKWKSRVESAEHNVKLARNEVNSYKIKFNEIAVTREEITDEIAEMVKKELISKFENHKGALSKKTACEIIGEYKTNYYADKPTEKGGTE